MCFVGRQPGNRAAPALPSQVMPVLQAGGVLGVPRMRRRAFLGGRETSAKDLTSRTWVAPIGKRPLNALPQFALLTSNSPCNPFHRTVLILSWPEKACPTATRISWESDDARAPRPSNFQTRRTVWQIAGVVARTDVRIEAGRRDRILERRRRAALSAPLATHY